MLRGSSPLLPALLVTAICGCRGLAPDTEIGRAAAAGGIAVLESLLKNGADPNLFDSHGIAPLHTAARLGRTEAIRALVKAGGKADLRDRRNGWTPLLHAVHKRRHQAVLALLESGADPNGRGSGGVTPLIMAAGYGSTETVEALLERGADPRSEAGGGITALWGALGGGGLADITDGPGLGVCFPDTVRALLSRAPDLRLKDNMATTAARFLARSQECREAYALVEPRQRSDS
jgi:hypothetical protein